MKPAIAKFFSALASMLLAISLGCPAVALAAQPEVEVENHTAAGAQAVSELLIDGVEAPSAGSVLDDRATVSTVEGATWEVPVLWIGDDLQLATEAIEGRTYLPAIAFFVPQEYTVAGDSFTIRFSDSLSKLFGDENAVSVFDSRTGITYILPFSLRDYFIPAATADSVETEQGESESEPAVTQSESAAAPAAASDEEDSVIGLGDGDSVIDIYCAKTARDALSEDDLMYLINLVLNKLEPQAVNLLIERFPSFKAAAAQNQIGREIGLYIYYQSGDKDGKPEHESAARSLAYVSADAVKVDGTIKYSYMIGIDVSSMLLSANDKLVTNASTNKYILDRKGEGMVTFNNTVVHELFHAFMDDYNRTGMLGAKNVVDGYTPNGNFVNEAQGQLYNALHYPKWFIEGTASAVENVYQYRYGTFKRLRSVMGSETLYEDSFTKKTVLYNYLNAKERGQDINFSLEYAAGGGDPDASRYVTGYLATLYLSQLAAQKDPSIGTAVDNQRNFSSEKLRLGLDSILRRMHNGETLDQVLRDISAFNGAAPLYNSTKEFEQLFIKGALDSEQYYHGNDVSMDFTLDFLNYMLRLETAEGRAYKPNGSILFDFARDFETPLDTTKDYTSEFFKIVNSNEFVPSTVSDAVAFAGGGKSDPPQASTPALQASATQEGAELPLAAKAEAGANLVAVDSEVQPDTALEVTAQPEIAVNEETDKLLDESASEADAQVANDAQEETATRPEPTLEEPEQAETETDSDECALASIDADTDSVAVSDASQADAVDETSSCVSSTDGASSLGA